MGFIEDLRRQRELEKEKQRLAELTKKNEGERRAAIVAQRQQQQQVERQRHEARKSQAKQFRNESGIGSLVGEFCRLIDSRRSRSDSYGDSYYDSVQPRDEDSYLDCVRWDESSGRPVADHTSEYSGKLIVVETCSDGTIQVHGGLFGSSKIPPVQWRNNKSVLESALEKAYQDPARYKRRYYGGTPGDYGRGL